jgi:hypothetical protein
MKSSIFWGITPSSLFKISWRFGVTCRLHLQSQRIGQAELCLLPASCWFLAWLILWPWRWRWYIPPKCRLTFSGLHSIISQKTECSTDTCCKFRLFRASISYTYKFISISAVSAARNDIYIQQKQPITWRDQHWHWTWALGWQGGQ